jgi:hypothetical protein
VAGEEFEDFHRRRSWRQAAKEGGRNGGAMAAWRTHPGVGGGGATGTGYGGGGGGGGSVGSADSVANMDDFLSESDSLHGGEAADSADGGVGSPPAEQRGKLTQRVTQVKLRPTATMVLSRGADGMPKMVPATEADGEMGGGGGGEVDWAGPVRGGWMQARPPSVGGACSRLALFVQP